MDHMPCNQGGPAFKSSLGTNLCKKSVNIQIVGLASSWPIHHFVHLALRSWGYMARQTGALVLPIECDLGFGVQTDCQRRILGLAKGPFIEYKSDMRIGAELVLRQYDLWG
jgi:hypothetical protein